MRFFDLLNFQDIMVYLFSALIFILLFGLFLAYSHFHTHDSEERKTRVQYRFPAGIGDRYAPFPLAMGLTIIGTVLWGFLYILFTGLLEVKI
ncbi:MAG: hypothetical protein WAK95_07945 [Desulfobacterales bacterium]